MFKNSVFFHLKDKDWAECDYELVVCTRRKQRLDTIICHKTKQSLLGYYITITLMFTIEIVCSKTQRKICNVVSVLITLYDCVDIQKKDVFNDLSCISSKNAVTMI